MSTSTLIRLSKVILSLSVGLLASLIVLNNIIDYWTNFHFVSHVLSMDTTFPESKTRNRAITSQRWFHIGYAFIILMEGIIGVLCTIGGIAMLGAIQKDSETFHKSKRYSIAGLLSGLLLWFTGFQVIAAEWFSMWMSKEWNGLGSAARLTQIVSAVLVFVSMKNDE